MNYTYFNNESVLEQYNAPILVFVCRDKSYKRQIVNVCDKENLTPEFYVEKEEYEKFVKDTSGIKIPNLLKVENAPDSNYGEKTVKLTTTFPWQVKQLRKLFSHSYLADVKWEKMCVEKMGLTSPYIEVPDDFNDKWLKVNEIKQLPPEKYFYVPIRWIGWDIENNEEIVWPIFNGWKDAEKCPIVSISAYDSYEKNFHRFIWHRLIKENKVYQLDKPWERKGKYYVPALKSYKEYNRTNFIIQHEFTIEEDMIKGYVDWYSKTQPDCQLGFNSEGGYKTSSKKGYSHKRWFTGFDMPYFYQRAKTLGLENYVQRMSPLPSKTRGVKFRKTGKNTSVEILGVCSIDWIYTNEIFGYHRKFTGFRGGSLQSYMSFFLGFGKVPHKEQVFEMWRDNVTSDYDPSKPEIFGEVERKNLVKELYEKAKLI